MTPTGNRTQALYNRAPVLVLSIASLAILVVVFLLSRQSVISPATVAKSELPDLNALPLAFEKNMGQTGPEAQFVAHAARGTLLFTTDEIKLTLPPAGEGADQGGTKGASLCDAEDSWNGISPKRMEADPSILRLRFVGTEPSAEINSGASLPGKVNYLLGDDPSEWRTDVSTYSDITYAGLYPGIDLFYAGGSSHLKGTYFVAPGADPAFIAWRYEGAQSVSVDAEGNLQIEVQESGQDPKSKIQNPKLTEQAPVAWQEVDGQRVPVEVSYMLDEDGTVRFDVGRYDPSRVLTIDPVLTYSTYLGGNWAETGHSIAVDSAGNFYVTGYTNSTTFPRVNAFQNNFGGGAMDAFVAKFDPQGQPVYTTYLGGSSSDEAFGVATDSAGNAYIIGSTSSQNFPIANAFQPAFGGGIRDAFITKLNPTGSALVFSTYLGGSIEDNGADVEVDSAGNIYLAGYSSSNNFPTRNPIQATRNGNGPDLFISKLNPAASDLVWSTYLGGLSSDMSQGVSIDSSGNVFVTGFTYSFDFPTAFAYQNTLRGTRDGFLTKVNAAGSALVYSTFWGGGADDMAKDVDVDGAGNAFIAGYTDSVTFFTLNAFQNALLGLSDAFVSKFDPTGLPLYSTYLGGNWLDGADGIAVNAAGEAFVMGSTQSDDFPLANPLYSHLSGSEDVFVSRVHPTGLSLVFSTYFGGSDNREMQSGGGAIAIDAANSIYFTGDTGSSDFPTYNPFQPFRGSAVDAFVSRISETGPTATPTRTGSPQPTATVCIAGDYTITQGTGTIVPGTTFLPNSACDNCTAPIAFPFPIRFYDQVFTQGRVSTEGNLQFTSNVALQANFCLPYGGYNNTIFVFWEDLWMGDRGIYTAVTGSAPNRVLNIEWRGRLSINNQPVQFELRLFEDGQQFETIYAQTGGQSGNSATVGVQRDTGSLWTQFSCNQPVITAGLKLTFTQSACLTPSATLPATTPTATPSPTATAPTLLYSTYLSSWERDILEDVARDAAGNIYVMGTTFQTDINYGSMWLSKFSPDGQQLLYEQIIGGNRIDYGYALAVDAAGNATIAGIATSNDFPTFNPLQAQHNGGIYDVIMTKYNPQGGIIFSTYLGGNGTDYVERLQTDAAGNIYLTGRTDSANWPTTPGAYQPANRGRMDGYVTKINPNGSAIIWSTYLGGLYADSANDLALDTEGNIYITGHTVSPDFPTLNPFQPTIADTSGDVFVTKMNPQGTGLIYSTFLGGSFPPGPGEDNGQGITVDAAGHAYVTGFTESPNFPTTSGSFQPYFEGYSDAFVTKFAPNGSSLVYSTFLGGTLNSPYGEDIAYDIAVDGAGQAHITGKTYSPDFPIVNAVQPLPGAVYDAFVTKFNAAGSGLIYSTFLGGDYQPPSFTGNDVGLGIMIDSTGNAIIAGGTASVDFPVVNAYQSQSIGPGDGFIAKISGSNPALTPTPIPTGQATATRTPTITPTSTPCGFSQPLLEGFESTTLGVFAATSDPANMPGWRATNNASHTGGWSAYSPSTYTAGDQRLTTINPVTIPTDAISATMRFWHRYLLEPGYPGECIDGGVLEISVNGGASWQDAEQYFTSGGYNGEIIGWQNPLEGRRGWCGESVLFSQVVLNLSQFAGESLLFRFRQGTDTYIAHDGWWIDDVSVSATSACNPSSMLVGHVNWEGRPSQPSQLQSVPITLTLKLGNTETSYSAQVTDPRGFFTVTLGNLPGGTYSWRVDDAALANHTPNYLANSGAVTLAGAPVTNAEMGLMKTGDADGNNRINVADFNITKVTFGSGCGNPLYDGRADFTGDCIVNVADFTPLKRNFGQEGAPPIGPRVP